MVSTNPALKYTVLKKTEQTKSIIEIWDNGIIYVRIKDNVEIEISDSIEQNIYISSNAAKKDRLVLVNSGTGTSITKEAREHGSSDEAQEPTLAMAVLVKNLPQRIIVNFIMKMINRNKMKMKLFSQKEEAILWLLSKKA